jgi:hypothetical protein
MPTPKMKSPRSPATSPCSICGELLTKSAALRHITAKHKEDGSEKARLIRASGRSLMDGNDYWILFDVPRKATLWTIDAFLRDIWLECCGHLSMFIYKGEWPEYDDDEREFNKIKNTRVSNYAKGETMRYMYDMGDTTELKIEFLDELTRPKHRTQATKDSRNARCDSVRVLARNAPYEHLCVRCKKKPAKIALERQFLCGKCVTKQEKEDYWLEINRDTKLPNSPRVGQCAYEYSPDEWLYEEA